MMGASCQLYLHVLEFFFLPFWRLGGGKGGRISTKVRSSQWRMQYWYMRDATQPRSVVAMLMSLYKHLMQSSPPMMSCPRMFSLLPC